MIRTLPREPWRGSQICGWQTEYGVVPGRVRYCAERKAEGEYFCPEHTQDMLSQYGHARAAEGNALGDMSVSVALLWEPYDDNPAPVEPTYEELADYQRLTQLPTE